MTTRAIDVPLGILQLLAILERDHKTVDFVFYDANAHRLDDFKRGNMPGLDEVLEADDYDAIGIGGLITSYNYIKSAVRRCKDKQPHAKIIAGGGFFSAIPSDIMSLMPEIDYGVIGEAYVTFPELLDRVRRDGGSSGDRMSDIQGVVSRLDNGSRGSSRHGEIVFSEPRQLISDMDWLPFPAYKYAPLDTYFKYSGLLLSEISMTARKRLDANMSLSCPFLCRFCWDLGITSVRPLKTDASGTVQVVGGRPGKDSVVRQHSPEYIGRYIAWLREMFTDIPYNDAGEGVGYPVDFVAWMDENIVAHNAQTGFTWLKSIRDELWRRDLIPECIQKGQNHNPDECSGPHFGGTMHAGLAKKDMLDTMKQIGFVYGDYGLESWDADILHNIGKGATPKKNAEAITLTMQAGMAPIPNQIIMFPDESWKSIYEMLDAWETTGIITVPFIATPYPGAEWFEKFRPFIMEQYGDSLDAFLSDLQDATAVSALITKDFSVAEAIGIQSILGEASKTQDFVRARRLLKLSEKEWMKRRA